MVRWDDYVDFGLLAKQDFRLQDERQKPRCFQRLRYIGRCRKWDTSRLMVGRNDHVGGGLCGHQSLRLSLVQRRGVERFEFER